jgi:thiol-disulfide isomerase/thioredoxin
MMPLGTVAPDFALPDTASGNVLTRADVSGPIATVIMFICNHCPYVKHIEAQLAALGRDYGDRGVGFAAISANDVANYPDDAPAKMREKAAAAGYPFPYLYDESQETARAYAAACTPDFYIFDAACACVYRGQLDDSRPGNGTPVTGRDMRAALDALIAGAPVAEDQTPSVGCNIKWKSA